MPHCRANQTIHAQKCVNTAHRQTQTHTSAADCTVTQIDVTADTHTHTHTQEHSHSHTHTHTHTQRERGKHGTAAGCREHSVRIEKIYNIENINTAHDRAYD